MYPIMLKIVLKYVVYSYNKILFSNLKNKAKQKQLLLNATIWINFKIMQSKKCQKLKKQNYIICDFTFIRFKKMQTNI